MNDHSATSPMQGVHYMKAPERDSIGDNASVQTLVSEIIADVRKRGDAAVRDYCKQVRQGGAGGVRGHCSRSARRRSPSWIRRRAPTPNSPSPTSAGSPRRNWPPSSRLRSSCCPGLHLGHRVIPIERVGCYVPGGRYPLLSAPIMTIVPAKVAGCDEVVACLPPNAHRAMIAGCHLSGADRIFRIGGAQAIAAMAFGTETVPAVDKIVGPGNAFVNEAKRQVFGPVGIDQLAGPSEIFIVADQTGDAEMIATDMLAQAEHDVRTRVGLDHHGPRAGRGDAARSGAAAQRPLDGRRCRPGLAGLWRDRRVRQTRRR